ncbi:MAG: HD domain-containing phosphohydrolase, partial [Chloroflexota bacterium]|nr:HD domain-containing phosphohydrolase [Chloroflexota bacterium]
TNNGRSAARPDSGRGEQRRGVEAQAFATSFWQRLSASLGARLLVLALLMAAGFAGIYAAGAAGKFNPQNYWLTILAAAFWFGLAVGLANAHLGRRNEEPALSQSPERSEGAAKGLARTTESPEATSGRLAESGEETRDATEALRHTVVQQGQLLAEIRALQALDTAILGGIGEQELMQLTTGLLGELTGAKTCAVVTPAADSSHLALASVWGIAAEDIPQTAELVGQLHIGESVAGWAILQGRPASSSDVEDDPRYARGQGLVQHLGIGSALAAPIMDGNTAIGALLAAFPERGEVNGQRLGQVKRLANQLSVCIQHARQQTTLKRLTIETVFALAEAIESRDPHTADHCTRLAHYADLLASSLGLAEEETEIIRYGAALHDAGKVGVSDAILKKPDKLTPEEWAEIRLHPYIGGQLCKRVTFLRDAYPIVYYHHERYDGNGYPDGLRGQDIPLAARIVAVADAYDAMTSHRPYRAAMSHAQAVRELRRGAGSQWDPELVPIFLKALRSGPGRNGRTQQHEHARQSRRNVRPLAPVA